jgi:hypothetical protein
MRIFSLLDSKSSQFAIGLRIEVSAIYKINTLFGKGGEVPEDL